MCGGGEKNLEIRCLVCSSAKSTDTKWRLQVQSKQKLMVSHARCHWAVEVQRVIVHAENLYCFSKQLGEQMEEKAAKDL